MDKGFIIAIDGPLASGKGTIAKRLAHVLKGIDLYTGAMYRCVALFCINNAINLNDATEVSAQLNKIKVTYKDNRILLNDTDVTEAIQEAAIAEGSSVVAVIKEVRKELVKRQQQIGREESAKGKVVVVEGRDIGTVVFPDATLKLYLTASEEVRANRRLEQYKKLGDQRTFQDVLDQIRIRDKRDTERMADPLTRDPGKYGYVIIDNSDMSEEQTINAIIDELKKKELL